MITAEPDITHIHLTPEDEFLILACDGVWDCMTNQQCVDFVRARLSSPSPPSPSHTETDTQTQAESTRSLCVRVCEEVIDACLAEDPRKSTGIGGDNMTCMVVQLKDRGGGEGGGGVGVGEKRGVKGGEGGGEGGKKEQKV
jgi:serine/threonine protein phosphatase PrpC